MPSQSVSALIPRTDARHTRTTAPKIAQIRMSPAWYSLFSVSFRYSISSTCFMLEMMLSFSSGLISGAFRRSLRPSRVVRQALLNVSILEALLHIACSTEALRLSVMERAVLENSGNCSSAFLATSVSMCGSMDTKLTTLSLVRWRKSGMPSFVRTLASVRDLFVSTSCSAGKPSHQRSRAVFQPTNAL